MKLNEYVKKVIITREEGSTGVGVRQRFDTLKDASDWLVAQKSTFPTKASGDYDAHRLTIIFIDDTKFKSRLDCNIEEDLDVKTHFLEWLEMIAVAPAILRDIRKD
jgi:hypothetical protein